MRWRVSMAAALIAVGCGADGGDDRESTAETGAPAPLTPEAFSKQLAERLCAEYAACNPDVECDPAAAEVPGADCQFDEVKARECLDGTFLCNAEFGEGYEFVEAPGVCDEVFTDCAATTR